MRPLLIFFSACVTLAAVKAAIVALLILFAASLLWGLYLHPREVTGFFAYCTALSLIGAHPMASLAIIGIAVITAQFAKMKERDRGP